MQKSSIAPGHEDFSGAAEPLEVDAGLVQDCVAVAGGAAHSDAGLLHREGCTTGYRRPAQPVSH